MIIRDIIKIEGSLRIRARLSPTGYTKEGVTITIKATGNVKKVIKPDNNEEEAVEGSIETTYKVNSNGTYIFKVEDEEGNQTEKKVIVNKIDTVAPKDFTIEAQNITEVGFTIEGETQDGEATEGSACSGIDRYEYFVKKDTETNYPTTPYTTKEITGLAQGSYKVYAVAYDKAGNFKKTNEITVKISMKIAKLMKNGGILGSTNFVFDTSGNLWGCGDNSCGQLGNGSTANSRVLIPIQAGTKFKEVSATQHVLAIDEAGNLWAWGNNIVGQVGNNSTNTKGVLKPTQIKPETKFKDIAAGTAHSLAIDEEGNLWAWGSNGSGQLGNNSTNNSLVPIQIKAGTKFKKVSAGANHSFAIDEDDNLWGFGGNGVNGVLGNGSTAHSYVPIPIKPGTKFKEIAAGGNESLAIDSEGHLWTWGANDQGQLGNNSSTSGRSIIPINIKQETKFKKIAIGNGTCYAIDEEGNLWGWGKNSNSQLGNNSTTNSLVPIPIKEGTRFKEIIGGIAYAIALDEAGNAWGFGSDNGGRIFWNW